MFESTFIQDGLVVDLAKISAFTVIREQSLYTRELAKMHFILHAIKFLVL